MAFTRHWLDADYSCDCTWVQSKRTTYCLGTSIQLLLSTSAAIVTKIKTVVHILDLVHDFYIALARSRLLVWLHQCEYKYKCTSYCCGYKYPALVLCTSTHYEISTSTEFQNVCMSTAMLISMSFGKCADTWVPIQKYEYKSIPQVWACLIVDKACMFVSTKSCSKRKTNFMWKVTIIYMYLCNLDRTQLSYGT